jgi:predicted dehydrogenase
MTTRFAMIGCGGFSRRYHVPTLLADTDVRLVGIFDPFPAPAVGDLARSLAQKHGLKWGGET